MVKDREQYGRGDSQKESSGTTPSSSIQPSASASQKKGRGSILAIASSSLPSIPVQLPKRRSVEVINQMHAPEQEEERRVTSQVDRADSSDIEGSKSLMKYPFKYIDIKRVDAVRATSRAGILLLKGVRSAQQTLISLDRLKARERERHETGDSGKMRRKLSCQVLLQNDPAAEIVRPALDLLGRRARGMSMLTTSYQPEAILLRQKAQVAAVEENKQKEIIRKALERWKMSVDVDVMSLVDQPLQDEDFYALAGLVSENLPFRVLDLTRCYLTDTGVQVLFNALAWNTVVDTLILRESFITDKGAEILSEMLRVNDGICSLDLKYCNGIGKTGMTTLLPVIEHHTRLRNLNGVDLSKLLDPLSTSFCLPGYEIGLLEAFILANHLKAHKGGLLLVDLSDCKLTSELFEALAEGLAASQTSLQEINLEGNRLDATVLFHLATVLHKNRNVTTINVSNNTSIRCSAYEECGLQLIGILQAYPSITVFDLSDNTEVESHLLKLVAEKLLVNRALHDEESLTNVVQKRFMEVMGPPRKAMTPGIDSWRLLHKVDDFFMRKNGLKEMKVQYVTTRPSHRAAARRFVTDSIENPFNDATDTYNFVEKVG